jgi:hypothetical protein
MPIRHGMVHVNYGSYTLAIREGDWKLNLPSGVYVAQDGTILVETTGKGPNDKFQPYILCNPAVATPGLQLITAADLKSFWPTTMEHCGKVCFRGKLLSSTALKPDPIYESHSIRRIVALAVHGSARR